MKRGGNDEVTSKKFSYVVVDNMISQQVEVGMSDYNLRCVTPNSVLKILYSYKILSCFFV